MTTKTRKSKPGKGAGPPLPEPSIDDEAAREPDAYSGDVEDYIQDAESVAFVIHDNPDPDALASGFAGYKLAEKYGTDAAIYHGEDISHEPNQKFADELGIPNTPYSEADQSLEDFKEVLLLDTHGGHLNGLEEFEKDLYSHVTGIIDHHDDNSDDFYFPNLSEKDKWIEENSGSTATLWTEILESDEYFESDEVKKADKIHTLTALMRGIETDTHKMEDATDRDKESYEIAERKYNELTGEEPDIYEKLLSEERQRKQDLEYNMELKIKLDSLGPVEYLKVVEPASDRKDDIWRAADYEIKNAEENTAVISGGEVENGTENGVKMSSRVKFEDETISDQFNFEEFLTESHVLDEAKENNNMGTKQIRKIHEAGGWMPEIEADDFKAGLVDLASSHTLEPQKRKRNRRRQNYPSISMRKTPPVHNTRIRPSANIIFPRSPRRTSIRHQRFDNSK